MKINNFRGDLTDLPAIKEALVSTDAFVRSSIFVSACVCIFVHVCICVCLYDEAWADGCLIWSTCIGHAVAVWGDWHGQERVARLATFTTSSQPHVSRGLTDTNDICFTDIISNLHLFCSGFKVECVFKDQSRVYFIVNAYLLVGRFVVSRQFLVSQVARYYWDLSLQRSYHKCMLSIHTGNKSWPMYRIGHV